MNRQQGRDSLKNMFPFPNDIFMLGLCPGELAVYAYLRRCENRKTHQCWPSYKTIGKAVGMSENTVSKYIGELVDKGLISAEYTSIITRSGKKRNGNLLYGYLKKPLKEQVDAIVDELAKIPAVAECYEVWNDLRDELESYYKDKPRQHVPLSQQKEFKTIKNMIIREADDLRLGICSPRLLLARCTTPTRW